MGKQLSKVGRRGRSAKQPAAHQAPGGPAPEVSSHERTILALKLQRDEFRQYKKQLDAQQVKEQDLVKQLVQEGKTDKAKLLLKKKRFQDHLLEESELQLDSVLRMCDTVEFYKIEMAAVTTIEKGNEALKKIRKMITLENIEKILEESHEGNAKQAELDHVFTLSSLEERKMLDAHVESDLKQLEAAAKDLISFEAHHDEDEPTDTVPTSESVPLPSSISNAAPSQQEENEGDERVSSFISVTQPAKGFVGAESEVEFVASPLLSTKGPADGSSESQVVPPSNSSVSGVDTASTAPLRSTPEISGLLPEVPTHPIESVIVPESEVETA